MKRRGNAAQQTTRSGVCQVTFRHASWTTLGLLLAACDSFAPAVERGGNEEPPRPATIAVPAAFTTAPISSTTSSGSPSVAQTTASCGTPIDDDGDGATVPSAQACGLGMAPQADPANDDCNDADAALSNASALYADADEDGFGDPSTVRWVCEGTQVEGFVSNSSDCDDNNSEIFERVYRDEDGDGYGSDPGTCGKDAVDGSVLRSGDCDDTAPAIHPELPEEVPYDGIDNNCDGYDIQIFREEQPEVIAWAQGALCPAWAVAVVALEHGATPPGGVFLQVGHVGTRDIFDVTLVLRRFQPPGPDVITTITLPTMYPNQVIRTERIDVGSYEVTFEYGPGNPLMIPSEQAGDAGTTVVDGGQWSAATHYQRCALTQRPLQFTAARLEPR